jgi:hypothetical protein
MVSEALGRRAGLAERCRIVCAERGIGQADPWPASPLESRCYQACRRGNDLRTTSCRHRIRGLAGPLVTSPLAGTCDHG